MHPSRRSILHIAAVIASVVCPIASRHAGAADDRPIEATSLLGEPLRRPAMEGEALAKAQADLVAARLAWEADPGSEEAVIWVGRRLGYLGRYGEAIAVLTEGLERRPDSPRLLRHRGHRFITLRRFDDAERDLSRAAELVRGRPDEVEPDGQPNERNEPRSTLNSNIFYHLGLARYLKGDFGGAIVAYDEGMPFARANDDMLVAMADWRARALMRLGRVDEARKGALLFEPELDIIENHDYHRLLLLYSGRAKAEDLLEAAKGASGVGSATLLYGVGNWLWLTGDPGRGLATLQAVVAGEAWPAFGFIAAEADLARAGVGAPAGEEEDLSPHDALRADAENLAPLAESALTRRFLAGVPELPTIGSRTIYYDAVNRVAFTEARAKREGLKDADLAQLRRMDLDDTYYYYTNYGTPLAYMRALDIAARHGFQSADGKRILDFGYGSIGHLRLLAGLGADVAGVEVDPILEALYSEAGDTGPIQRSGSAGAGADGRLRVLRGRWPADQAITAEIDGGYDLFLSKNVLKYGYLNPQRATEARRLVRLGVDHLTYLEAVRDALKPGGLALIYNLSPAPAPPDKPYIPWADGGFPFPRGLVETVGLEVVAWDEDDSAFIRRMGSALGWGEPSELEATLFAHYTLLRRPTAPAAPAP